MKKIKKIELLSPAGSFDALKQAIHNGADAVYLGGSYFGARAYAHNFDNDELKKAVEYAHLYGVKIYITVNTLVFEEEISEFKKYIDFLVSIGADALIMQDIGMANWVINTYDIPVHSSTQMHNYPVSNIEYLRSCRFQRAVLARETEQKDIRQISQLIETEVFAHGALCICYSGQCLFSAVEHNRSGNRGRCAQACRMKYSLYSDNKLIIKDKFLLSPKDLALLEDTDKIISSGAASIKIEGRMKSPEYVGYITKTYRDIIDKYYNPTPNISTKNRKDTLMRLFNRGFTKGYAFGHNNQTLMSSERPNHAGVYIGDIVSANKEFISIYLNKPLHQGDGIKFDKSDKGLVCNKIYYKGKLVNKGYPGHTIQLENKLNIRDKDRVMLTKDTSLLKTLSNYKEKKISISAKAEFRINQPAVITLSDKQHSISCKGSIVARSINAPLSKDSIEESLLKTGDSPYSIEKIDILMDKNIFLSKSNINQLRRNAVNMLNSERTKINRYIKKDYRINFIAPLPFSNSICCTVVNENQLRIVANHKVNRIYINDYNIYKKYKSKLKNIYYMIANLSENITDYTGENLVIRDTGGIRYAKNNEVCADYLLNITNSSSLAHLHLHNLESICLSVELDEPKIKSLTQNYKEEYGFFPNTEVLVYGRIQLMATKHCALDGHIACGKCKTSDNYIEDMHGHHFPLLTDIKCNNYIYSKEPVNIIHKIDKLKSIGINGFRLDFIDETPEEIHSILENI